MNKHEATVNLPATYTRGFVILPCVICHRNVRVTGNGIVRGHIATPAATIAEREATR